jgi:hypothetical protein
VAVGHDRVTEPSHGGYIADGGYGQHAEHAPLPMSRSAADPEVWEVVAADFDSFVGRLYMCKKGIRLLVTQTREDRP